jgi:hypothetical protein
VCPLAPLFRDSLIIIIIIIIIITNTTTSSSSSSSSSSIITIIINIVTNPLKPSINLNYIYWIRTAQ